MRFGWWKSKTDGSNSEESGFLFDTGHIDVLNGALWDRKFRAIGSFFGFGDSKIEKEVSQEE
ncbi:hypothetical protein [Azospirillum argentinense]